LVTSGECDQACTGATRPPVNGLSSGAPTTERLHARANLADEFFCDALLISSRDRSTAQLVPGQQMQVDQSFGPPLSRSASVEDDEWRFPAEAPAKSFYVIARWPCEGRVPLG